MKFFILLVVAAVALADDLSSAENHLRGHGGSRHGGISHGGSHRGGISHGSWGRGRRDVADDVLVTVENPNFLADQYAEEVRNRGHSGGHIGGSHHGGISHGSWGRGRRDVADDVLATVENPNFLADQYAEEVRNRGHSGGHIGGSWGGSRGSWGGQRWRRDTDLAALVLDDDQALEASQWGATRRGGNPWGGQGSVVISGHRWRRDVDLTAEEGRIIGLGGRNWATSNQGRGNGWNHGNVWNSGIPLNRRW